MFHVIPGIIAINNGYNLYIIASYLETVLIIPSINATRVM